MFSSQTYPEWVYAIGLDARNVCLRSTIGIKWWQGLGFIIGIVAAHYSAWFCALIVNRYGFLASAVTYGLTFAVVVVSFAAALFPRTRSATLISVTVAVSGFVGLSYLPLSIAMPGFFYSPPAAEITFGLVYAAVAGLLGLRLFEKRKAFLIDVQDKPGFLSAVMRELAGVAEVSLEGDHGTLCRLAEIPGVSFAETTTLRRGTLEVIGGPMPDFLVLPLNDETVPAIERVITKKALTRRIAHVQIAVGDRMVFGAFDWFHPDCIVAYEGFPTALLDRLVENGVIRSYEATG